MDRVYVGSGYLWAYGVDGMVRVFDDPMECMEYERWLSEQE